LLCATSRKEPLLCGGATSHAFGLKIMLPSPHSQQHGVKKIACHLSQSLFSNFNTAFCLFTALPFALSLFEFCEAYQNRAQLFIFVELLLGF